MAHDSASFLLHIRLDGYRTEEHLQCILLHSAPLGASDARAATYNKDKPGHHLNLDAPSPLHPDQRL